MKELDDKSVDLILCDLPYGVTDCEWDVRLPFGELWGHYERIIKDRGAVVLFSVQPLTSQLIMSNKKRFRYCWYWKKNNKTGFTFAKYQPMRCIEDICVFYRQSPTYNPQGLVKLEKPIVRKKRLAEGKEYIYSQKTLLKEHTTKYKNYPVHLLEFKNDAASQKNRYHPTQKPVALLEYLIKTYTDEGDVVLDNCMGSGSTCVAAANTGRQYIGMELAPRYYEIAKNRLKEAAAKREESWERGKCKYSTT